MIDFQNSYGDQNSYACNRKSRTILDKLQKYTSISEEVRNMADVVYNKMTVKQHRKTRLVQLLYWCCYCAHLELNLDVSPQQLGKVFNLTTTEVSRCGSMFSYLETGYQPPKSLTTPLNYLPGFCRSLAVYHSLQLSDNAIEQCLSMADRIISKQPSLLYEPPLNVACGIFKYYLIINGIQIDDLRSIVGLSDSTVNPWCKVVENIDNNTSSSSSSVCTNTSVEPPPPTTTSSPLLVPVFNFV